MKLITEQLNSLNTEKVNKDTYEAPFEICYNYRAQALRNRRKLLRKRNQNKKVV